MGIFNFWGWFKNNFPGTIYKLKLSQDLDSIDITIDNLLIDIKCTIGDNNCYEILQLLGYSALLQNNPVYNKNIQQISILNLLDGNIVFYDTTHINNTQYLEFLKILTQK